MHKHPNANPLEEIITGASSGAQSPFTVSVLSYDQVIVNYYSSLLQNLDIRNSIPIVGLNQPFQITYGDKIYLELYFDQNLNVISARIRHDERWMQSATIIKTTTGALQGIPTYPNELEIISPLDIGSLGASSGNLSNKTLEIQADINSFKTQANANIADINLQITNGSLSNTQGQLLITAIRNEITTYTASMLKLVSVINSFFSDGASKKQLKAYKLIAYTTQDNASALDTFRITPDPAEHLNPPYSSFNLVQCLSNDLMLVDYCYKNVACKVPILWSRPVYYFQLADGNAEDADNTGVS